MKNKILLIFIVVALLLIIACTKNAEKNETINKTEYTKNTSLTQIKECENDLDCPQPKCIGARGICDNNICKIEGKCLTGEELSSKDKECYSDFDCVKAGCSKQLCVSKDKSDIITTCEYNKEYGCLKKTSCGCVLNKCKWQETGPYKDCIKNIKP